MRRDAEKQSLVALLSDLATRLLWHKGTGDSSVHMASIREGRLVAAIVGYSASSATVDDDRQVLGALPVSRRGFGWTVSRAPMRAVASAASSHAWNISTFHR
jgi:hypothetical protein